MLKSKTTFFCNALTLCHRDDDQLIFWHHSLSRTAFVIFDLCAFFSLLIIFIFDYKTTSSFDNAKTFSLFLLALSTTVVLYYYFNRLKFVINRKTQEVDITSFLSLPRSEKKVSLNSLNAVILSFDDTGHYYALEMQFEAEIQTFFVVLPDNTQPKDTKEFSLWLSQFIGCDWYLMDNDGEIIKHLPAL